MYLFIHQPIMLQGWLLYTELIHFSVQLQFQSLLWVILHDQLLIVVSKINISRRSISTLCNVYSLYSFNTKHVYLPQVSHLQLHSRYHTYHPFPISKFHLLHGPPYRHTLNKGILSPQDSLTLFNLPPHLVGQSSNCLTSFGYLPRVSSQENTITLASCKSPSVNENNSLLSS